MLGSKVIAVVAFALGASAAPAVAAEGKPFKLGVTTVAGKTIFLTNTGTATTDQSKGVDCVLNGDKVLCEGKGLTYGDMHTSVALKPTASAPNNKHFSIGSDGTIVWRTGPAPNAKEVHFSTKGNSDAIYAEICSTYGHPDANAFKPGKAKAYYAQ